MSSMQVPRVAAIRVQTPPKLSQVSISRPSEGSGAFFGRSQSAFQPAGAPLRLHQAHSGAPVRARFLGQPQPDLEIVEPLPPTLPDKSKGGYRLLEDPIQEVRGKAWGRIKKADAAELAAYLRAIEQRMQELNLPPGIVSQIREKLETFAEGNASEAAEIELTHEEGLALDGAINLLETREQSSSFATAAVLIAGVGILITVLV